MAVHCSACVASAELAERAGEMQQRILHGIMAVNAFISLLNHNSSSHVFSPNVLKRPVFCLFGFPFASQRSLFFFIFLLYRFYKEKRQFIIFLGQSKYIYLCSEHTADSGHWQDDRKVFRSLARD